MDCITDYVCYLLVVIRGTASHRPKEVTVSTVQSTVKFGHHLQYLLGSGAKY